MFAAIVSIALAVGVLMLGINLGSVKNQLTSRNIEIQGLNYQIDTANAATAKANSDLKDANATITDLQTKLDYQQLPEVHCTLGFYTPATSAMILNIDTKQEVLNIQIDRPSDHSTIAINDFILDGHTSRDIGAAQGWTFVSGDTITINQVGHRAGTWTAP
jgi:hypothetical protein